MVLAQEAFTTVLMVVDQNNNPATGKTISYIIYDETQTSWATGSMTEIGATGIYYLTWTPDEDGYWIFEAYYSGVDFKFYDIKMYQVGKGVEDAIFERIGAPAFSTIAGDIANLITRSKGLDEIHDDLVAHVTQLTTHDTDIKADLGDFSGQVNLQSLLAVLGIPDVAGKDLYTLLVTDRLDSATFGLNALKTLIDNLNADLGNFSGRTTLQSLLAILGWIDNPASQTLEQRLGTGYQLAGSIEADIATITGYGVDLKEALIAKEGTATGDGADPSKIVDTSLTEADDYWNGAMVVIVDGVCAGQQREITDFDQLNSEITVNPLFDAVIVTGVRYKIIHIRSAEAAIADLDADLVTHDADIKADLGDFSGQTNLQSLLAALGIPDVAGKPLYTVLVTDLLAHGTHGLAAIETLVDDIENMLKAAPSVDSILFKSGGAVCPAGKSIWDALGDGTVDLNALSTAIAAVNTDLGDYSSQTNLQSLLAALGIPDVAGKPLYTVLVTDYLAHGTHGLPAIETLVDDIENMLKAAPSVDSILFKSGGAVCPAGKSIWDALGDGTVDLNALSTAIAAVNTDLGDYSSQTNLQSLLAALGIPDVAGKPLYTVLVTDLLAHGTHGLAAIETLVDDIENMIKAAPSVDSILFKSGGAVCPAGKSIWDALGDGTVDLNALSTAIAAIQTDLGDWSGYTNFASLLAALGIPDVAGKDLYTVLVTDLLAHGTHGLAALETLVDSIETWLGDPSGDTLATITAKFGDLTESLTTILETFVSSPSGGLGDRIAFIQSLIQTNSTVNGAAGTVDKFDTNLTEASDDHYNGHVLMFTGGNLAGQSRLIIDYDGTTKEVTVHPSLTEAPADTNAFVIFTGGYQGALRTGSKGLQQIFDLIDQLFNLNRVGDTVTTDGTEQTIFIVDNPDFPFKSTKFLIDTTNHTATETIVLRTYLRLKSGGSYVEFDEVTIAGAIDPLGFVVDLHPNTYGIKITIEKTGGTNRDYDYEVYFEEK